MTRVVAVLAVILAQAASAGPTVLTVPAPPPTAIAPPAPTPIVVTPPVLPTATPEREAERRWYGWQIFIVDGAGFLGPSLLASGAGGSDKSVTYAGYAVLATYLLGSPIVHLVHHSPSKAGLSLLLRAGLPVIGGVGGYLVGGGATCRNRVGDDDDNGCLGALLLGVFGGLSGIVGAGAIDTAVLAFEPKTPTATSFTPLVVPTKDGFRLGLAGTF